jgi:hypothetical protein
MFDEQDSEDDPVIEKFGSFISHKWLNVWNSGSEFTIALETIAKYPKVCSRS